MYSVTLRRRMPQLPKTPIDIQIKYILDIALRGNRGGSWGWQCTNKVIKKDEKTNNKWIGIAELYFEKTKGRRNDGDTVENQWNKITEMIVKAGKHSKFNKYPWVIMDEDATDDPVEINEVAESIEGIKTEIPPGVHDVCIPNEVLTIEDLRSKFPHELLNGTDEVIESHEAFRGIYARGPQIRSTLSSIWSFIVSNGERANHTLLWGLPACAKTQILLGIIKIFGEGAVLRLDSTSTTRAGLESLIFKKLKKVPPLFISEEIEKANEDALRIWLGGMDDRHEFRKVNFHMHQVRKVHFLALATANDKEKFDSMMGGRTNYPGALSSRFVHQYECPRPNEEQMRRILARDIARFGGKIEWIEPCIELSRAIKTNDPRKILGFLDGGDNLLNGHYQKDQFAMHGVNQ